MSEIIVPKRKEHPKPFPIHIMTLGDAAVGKSCLIRRFSEGNFFQKYVPTIGVDFGVKEIALQKWGSVLVNYWDLSGHPDFLEVRNEFYKPPHLCVLLLVYDIQSRRTFESLEGWIEELRQYASKHSKQNETTEFEIGKQIKIIVVGNKKDVVSHRVTEHEAKAWAASKGMQFFEVSAFTGDKVKELFDTACDLAMDILYSSSKTS